jgi:hypothetical protein
MLLSGMDSGVRKAAERLARAHGLRVLGAVPKPISREAPAGAAARGARLAAAATALCSGRTGFCTISRHFRKIGYYFD